MGEVMLALALLLTATGISLWFLVRSERHPPSKEPSLRRSPGRLPETQRRGDGKEKAKSSNGHI